jgi:serine protease
LAGSAGLLGGVAGGTGLARGDGPPVRTPASKAAEVLVGVSQPADGVRETVERHVPANAGVVHANGALGYAAVGFPASAPAVARRAFIDAITNRPGIEYAELNGTYEAVATPADPRYGEQYVPQLLGAESAWETTFGDSDVRVAVVDTGVAYDHPDLAANVRSAAAGGPGRDFVTRGEAIRDGDPQPDSPEEGHGTKVAGIVAALTDNDTGIAGLSQSTLLCGRVLDARLRGRFSDIADGIQWATDHGADVINLSLGGTTDSAAMRAAVAYAAERSVLVVAAAGNEGNDAAVVYPAAYEECLAVGALTREGDLARFSNTGPEVGLAAPAVDLHTTETDGRYGGFKGSSAATAVVSGVAGLALARWDLSGAELRYHLRNTAVDVGLGAEKAGAGRVDAANAVGTLPKRLTIVGETAYELAVEGALEKSTAMGVTIDDNDAVSGSTAEGQVNGGGDSYAYSGSITRFEYDGSVRTFLNEREVAPEAVTLPREIVVAGTGADADADGSDGDDGGGGSGDAASYAFAVDGALAAVAPGRGNDDTDDGDGVEGERAEGRVGAGDRDVYAFAGDVIEFDRDGPLEVFLDDEAVDPETLSPLPEELVLAGEATYELSVSGGLERSAAAGATVDDTDSLSGSTATGRVNGGSDAYEFSGSITALRHAGSLVAFRNGVEIDPATLRDVPAVTGASPTDPDGDGRYEDVNGDGRFDVVDVQALFEGREGSAVGADPAAFDFNDDGEAGIVDVQALFARLK